jgi:hypothetical protein
MIIYILLFIFLYLFYLLNRTYENMTNNYDILHLVLYSDDDYYHKMYELTREYYKKFNNVKTIYYKFSPSIDNDYKLENDILLIKGKESYVPGVLDKTIKAIKYFSHNNFNYLVRSNISSIINFDLINFDNVSYGGGWLLTVQHYDPPSGLYDERYWGTQYFQGTFIVFNKKLLLDILHNIHFIQMDLIDDVAFGVLIKEHYSNISPKTIPGFVLVNNVNDLIFNTTTCYRNKNNNRYNDVNNMEFIINAIK